jgi:hypothetical protein
MTIDERLERLIERHEALTQTVEILSRDIDALKTIAVTSLESINALARIAESHEGRISKLEGDQ